MGNPKNWDNIKFTKYNLSQIHSTKYRKFVANSFEVI